jgi:hypothetical protein
MLGVNFNDIKNLPYDQIGDAGKGAFLNFLDNTQGAARNTVRQMGGNPRINPYANRLAGKAGNDALLAMLDDMLAGSTPDNDKVYNSVVSGMGSGLMPKNPGRGREMLSRIGALSKIDDTDAAGLPESQQMLRTMFSQTPYGGFKGDSGAGSLASDIIQMLSGMGMPSMFGQFAQDSYKDRMQGFNDYYAPANPDKGFFDWLGV